MMNKWSIMLWAAMICIHSLNLIYMWADFNTLSRLDIPFRINVPQTDQDGWYSTRSIDLQEWSYTTECTPNPDNQTCQLQFPIRTVHEELTTQLTRGLDAGRYLRGDNPVAGLGAASMSLTIALFLVILMGILKRSRIHQIAMAFSVTLLVLVMIIVSVFRYNAMVIADGDLANASNTIGMADQIIYNISAPNHMCTSVAHSSDPNLELALQYTGKCQVTISTFSYFSMIQLIRDLKDEIGHVKPVVLELILLIFTGVSVLFAWGLAADCFRKLWKAHCGAIQDMREYTRTERDPNAMGDSDLTEGIMASAPDDTTYVSAEDTI